MAVPASIRAVELRRRIVEDNGAMVQTAMQSGSVPV